MGTLPRVLALTPCLRPTGRATFTLKEKRSEFIAVLVPVVTPEEARSELDRVRREHFSATHNCPAWRTGYPDVQEYSSDDGEPGGTAGRPILGALKKAELCNALLVVTRYFGGVKLGVRGLIDAYSAAAEGVIALTPTERALPFRTVRLRCGYPALTDVRHAIRTCGIPENRVEIRYDADVSITLTVAPKFEEALRAKSKSYEVRQMLLEAPRWAEEAVLGAAAEGDY